MKEAVKRITRYREIKAFIETYERFLIPGFLIVGVAADFVTFRTLNIKTAFTLLSIYAVIAGAVIAYLNVFDEHARYIKGKFFEYLYLVAPFILQFTFGALLSASFIFYWFSGALSVSWPFLLFIAALMASNEVFRDYFKHPVVQVSVWYFVLFSLLSLILPHAFKSLSVWLFIVSGILSFGIVTFYLEVLSKFLRFVQWERVRIYIAMSTILVGMFVLYFFRVIPPIPLSIRDAGIYHDIERHNGAYLLQDEKENIFERAWPGDTVYITPGERIYAYSAIFAPEDLDTIIVHDWQWYDRTNRQWQSVNKASFSLSGGREEGFRGYSWKSYFSEGRWRVSVENERGQVLGRVHFRIKHVDEPVDMIEVTK